MALPLHLHPLEADMANERERIDTGTDSRYVRRDDKGQFKESDDLGRSLSRDRKEDAENEAPRRQGDRGDHESRERSDR
jgi:hypothetical protein